MLHRSFCAARFLLRWHIFPAALALGLLAALPTPGVWFDETATVSATSRTWSQLWLLTQHQDVPLVGYYAVVKLVSTFTAGNSLLAGRTITAASYVGAVLLITRCGHRLWGERAGIVAGAALALLPSTMGAQQ